MLVEAGLRPAGEPQRVALHQALGKGASLNDHKGDAGPLMHEDHQYDWVAKD